MRDYQRGEAISTQQRRPILARAGEQVIEVRVAAITKRAAKADQFATHARAELNGDAADPPSPRLPLFDGRASRPTRS